MRNFIRLAFNGARYHGWQIQANAHSVQAELNTAMGTILRRPTETTGCGRTDTGVHAREFYAHFDTPDADSVPHDFVHHINCVLPNDISVAAIIPVQPEAHARFDATLRTYEYRLYHRKNPFLQNNAWFFPYDLDVDFMNELARMLKKYNDFSCFSKSRTQTLTKTCTITDAVWKQEGEELVFRISANRFLRNMVRAIVGTLLDAGEHKINEEEFHAILESKSRKQAGVSVPAHGLYLTAVHYPYL